VLRREIVDPPIAAHGGRIVKTSGDGLLLEFPSVVDAVRCVVEIQTAMAEKTADVPDDQLIAFRVGVNLGDIIIDGDDIFGDGVNIAARLQEIATPGGLCVSSRVHDDIRDRLDLTFEDGGSQTLKNIARPVQVWRWSSGSPAESASVPAPADVPLALPNKPSIAVLPFQNMLGDPEQEYFADGMVEEIITALSRIRWLFVIARNSSFTYKGHAVAVKQVGSELGVRYVLEGSVRKGSGQVRITAQLIEAESGTHLWADRFDGSLEDVFDLQDRVAARVAGVIEPTLQATEISRSSGRPTDDLTAYDLYLRALPTLFSDTIEEVVATLRLLDQAIARDPNYGPALAAAAYCYVQLSDNRVTDDPERSRRTGIEHARRAIAVAPEDPTTIAHAAMALALLGEDLETMIGLLDKALALNPSFARGWYVTNMILGISRLVDGRNDVISLRRIFNDIRAHRALITREAYVCYDGLRYDVSKIPPPWERGILPEQLVGVQLGGPLDASTPTRLHQMFDRLSNTNAIARQRSDQVSGVVFEDIDSLLSDPLIKGFRDRRNKFVAHAADPRSRANVSLSGYGITMADVEKALRLLLRANHLIQSQLLWASGGGLMPTAQFNVLEGLEGSADEKQLLELGEVWERLSEERDSWHE
jgi:TolB-like protein